MVNIREANKKDDFKKIAEFFFNTDPYIFPYMFGDVKESRKMLSKLIAAETGAFSHKNCVVAEKDGQIIGVALFLTKNTNFEYDYSHLSLMNERYAYTIKHYISKLKTYFDDDETYIAMLFVEEPFRCHHVATNLLKHIFETSGNKKFLLHVLKNNFPALTTYTKLDFKIEKEFKGFNGKHLRKPSIYEMTKTP